MTKKEKIVRPPIVEGIFYPDNKEQLDSLIKSSLLANSVVKIKRPFGIIVPYASYLYSSPIFASVYSQLINEYYDTIIIISPVHKIAFPYIALTKSDAFSLPLGELEVDKEDNAFLLKYNKEYIMLGEKYHLQEHSIEVQLPYLITVLGDKIKILPIIIGEQNTKFTILLSKALFSLIQKNKNKKYLIIATTNLSHEIKYEKALERDKKFAETLQKMNADLLAEKLALNEVEAYGGGCVVSLLRLAELCGVKGVNILRIMNSGDITNEKLKVEGYIGASIF